MPISRLANGIEYLICVICERITEISGKFIQNSSLGFEQLTTNYQYAN
jgi:hypothetical protein